VKGEYFNNGNIEGQPELTRIDNSIEFNWWDGVPVEGFKDDNFSIRWSGFLKAPVTGEYIIGCDGPHKARIEFNRKKIAEFDRYDSPAKVSVRVMLQKGKRYPLTIEFTDTKGMASINMLWKVPGKDLEKEAIRVARKADAVIMCMGLSPRIEGEEMKVEVKGFSGGDRISLGLPEIQQDLIKKIYSLGKPVVLVLINGSAVSVNWEKENIPAILEAWYPGQAAGTAIADILFGDYNPSGRLPVTFYKSEKDLPDFKDYNMEGKTYRYFRKEPLFEFGYGLSYTTFTYSNFKLPKEACIGDHVKLSVDVTNKGTVDGDEIVQLYLAVNNAPVPVPIRTLKGFTKVFLKAGETKTVEMYLNPEDFSIIDERGIRKVIPGSYTMSIGGRQPGREAVELKSVLISEIELKQN
jgi:beta-glucosidase